MTTDAPDAGVQPDDRPATSPWGLPGLVVAIAGVGPLVGFLWWAVAPVGQGTVYGSVVFPQATQPASYIGADVAFALLGLVVGIGAALLVRRIWQGSPVVAVAGLTLGGIGGAALAVLIGLAFGGRPPATTLQGQVADIPLQLIAPGWLLVWPIASVLVWFVLDVIAARSAPSPRPAPAPDPEG